MYGKFHIIHLMKSFPNSYSVHAMKIWMIQIRKGVTPKSALCILDMLTLNVRSFKVSSEWGERVSELPKCLHFLLHLGKIIIIWQYQILGAAHRIFDLSCGIWDLVPWPEIEPGSPALGAWSLSHWTTRKFHIPPFFIEHVPRLRSLTAWVQFSDAPIRSYVDLHKLPDAFLVHFSHWYMPPGVIVRNKLVSV